MSNFTETFEEDKPLNVNTFVYLKVMVTLEIVALALHALLQWVIFKLRVTENQYHLVRILSIFDSIHAILAICQVSYFIESTVNDTLPNQTVMVLLTMSVYIFHASPMLITVLIITDRWIAVKYPLRYQELVSKLRINIAVSISGTFCAVSFVCLFFIGDVRSVTKYKMFFTNQWTVFFLVTLRTVTCVIILVLGKLTMRLRDESEANRPYVGNLHGVEAERLDVIIKLKRSVKDVMKLNIWTCVFLIPMILFTLTLLMTGVSELGIKLNAVFGLINALSNPIVYLTCFSKIRHYWYRKCYRRGTIHTERC
uniref:G-protein coupled receptors family 1 profile domain-containing protein n=1 Tax=Clytia hemisphaerica TaxID=252671 RepID=A0A7M5WVG6_9CNID